VRQVYDVSLCLVLCLVLVLLRDLLIGQCGGDGIVGGALVSQRSSGTKCKNTVKALLIAWASSVSLLL
jgi:hypothetical protein